ncbi:uncharacterized protein L201_000161 [Kwoniella dendrophila CBS 6074]|uniref:Uncharacterized protein n=1 Tax=Kwoniella dendrophila CBS 6074 TaxID=1295534 RepID=A0AAX4JKL3_9TREE
MTTFLASVILSTTLLKVVQVNAAFYVGCFDTIIQQQAVGEYLYSSENGPHVDYDWGEYGGVGIYENCFCTDTSPDFSYFLNGDFECQNGINGEFGQANVNANSPQADQWMDGLRHAVSQAHEGLETATCGCYSNSNNWQGLPEDPERCQWEDWHVFVSTALPSGGAKKQLKQKSY